MTTGSASLLVSALADLDVALAATRLTLDVDGVAAARSERDELRRQIGDYLIPRLRRLDAPLLAVLGGSTGSGKSTITNALVGVTVSRSGVLRPTTRAPVLVCHPADEVWFAGGDVLGDLPRLTGTDPAASPATGSVLQIVTTDRLGPGLALIDAPDIDSVEDANRALATQLLAAADLWLFTTTAVRYADAVPWEFLHQAQARGTSLAVIINRIPPGAAGEIVAHFRSMLEAAGLAGTTVFPLDQVELEGDGLLPAALVAPVRDLLETLAQNADERARVVARTLAGALESVTGRVGTVAAGAHEQARAGEALRSALDEAYASARRDVAEDLSHGALLRGEVLDRWQELIGSAELMRALQSRVGRIRDRIGAFVRGRPDDTAEVRGAITSTLEQLLLDQADKAAHLTATSWRALPGGRRLLGQDRTLDRASDELRAAVGPEIRGWQDDILELVRSQAAGKRSTARIAAFGVNSVGLALMIVLFASTGGLTGAEVVVGAGTAGVSQALLTAIFGEQAVRELATEARRLLLVRIEHVFDTDADRFRARLEAEVAPAEQVDQLRSTLRRLEAAR